MFKNLLLNPNLLEFAIFKILKATINGLYLLFLLIHLCLYCQVSKNFQVQNTILVGGILFRIIFSFS